MLRQVPGVQAVEPPTIAEGPQKIVADALAIQGTLSTGRWGQQKPSMPLPLVRPPQSGATKDTRGAWPPVKEVRHVAEGLLAGR